MTPLSLAVCPHLQSPSDWDHAVDLASSAPCHASTCSHTCLPGEGMGYTCACPAHLTLDPAGSTCQAAA